MLGIGGAFSSKMNSESSSFARCVRHPSQFFTGFCSSCLVERLSTVDSVQASPKPSVMQRSHKQALVDQSLCSSNSDNNMSMSRQVRTRRTLLSLFHLDDENALGNQTMLDIDQNRVSRHVSRDDNVGRTNFGLETRHHGRMQRVSGGGGGCGGINGCDRKKGVCVGDEGLREKRLSYWLGSVLTDKLMKWKTSRSYRNSSLQEKNWVTEKQSDITVDMRRRSCDYKLACDSNKIPWEDPRHSWDGVMMSKGLTPSSTNINTTIDLMSGKPLEIDWHTSLKTHRRRMSLPDEAIMAVDTTGLSNNNTSGAGTTHIAEATFVSNESNVQESTGDMLYKEPPKDISVLNIRRRYHGWSRVWNRSITSPFRDFIQKRDNVLERSLSESWREHRGQKNPDTVEGDGKLHSYGSSISAAYKQHVSNRNNGVGNGDVQRYRPDSQKKNRVLGRSRSVHYPSPANPDSGLLRFYLTPLRSSRRVTRKRRMKRSFARSIFGL